MSELNKHDLLWCWRRMPSNVAKLLKEQRGKVFLAGGFIRSVIANEEVQDIDLFAPDRDTAKLIATQLELDGRKNNRRVRSIDTQNAFTVIGGKYTVQVIHRWTYSTPLEALASFDFTVAMAAIWWDGENWRSACHQDYYADLAGRRLVYTSPQRNEDAGGSVLRVLKFYQRGYRIPLDSLGAVVARLTQAVDFNAIDGWPAVERERQLAKVLTGLLREVDPNVDPDHISHLSSPSEDESST